MQKKKQYYEIKDGGVTLYWDMTANVLVDIDVQPGVKTVNLFAEKTASKYLYSTYRVSQEDAIGKHAIFDKTNHKLFPIWFCMKHIIHDCTDVSGDEHF